MSTGVIDNIHRPFAKVSPSPSLWGDLFIKPHSNPQVTEKYSKEIEGLKNEVRSMLTTPECKMADTIDLIDKLERLGVSYHFEKEIEEKMKQFFNVIKADHHHYKDEAYDLCTVALHFRLFRQHGYNLSSDVFERWMDGEGKFKENLKNDAKGLLSLYEACCLRTRGETLLDDALVFAGANLKSMVGNLRSPLREQVEHALFQQLHYGVQRIEARHFISIYENVLNRNETLLRFAKVDFNAVQILHKNELSKVSRWWKELNLISKLPYARDRVVECFLWAVAVYYEPHYSRARIMLTKCIAIVSVLDDTYDTYGTREELDALTEAIERWNIQETDTLPEYIKGFYKTILKLYMEFEEKLAKEGRSYAAYYTIESFKELARSYHVEAKWFTQGYLPPFEEYLDNALITSVVPHLSCSASFLGVESVKSKDFEWLLKKPKLVVASQIYNRFVDDASSHKVETERGQIGNGIDCYMKTYGVTKEEAKNRFYERATDAWKDTTEEWLNWPSSCSKDVYILMLNYNRIVHVAYKNDEDGYTQPEKVLMPHIIALFVHQFDI